MADGSKSANWSDATPAFQHNAHINDDTHSTSVTDRQKVARTINLACEGLWRRQPLDSAKTGLTVAQKSGLKAAVSAILFFLLVMPQATLLALYMIAMVLFSTMVILRLDAARLRLRFPEQTDQYPLLSPQEDRPTFTILVPLYREASVVRQTIEALSSLRYPRQKLQIFYLLEADDLETLEAFEHCQLPLHFKVIIIPPSPPRTKPRALNYGLAHAQSDFITVYDAEDIPHPDQLHQVASAFRSNDENCGVVQAPLFIHNPGQSWLASQFALEYTLHFRVWLPYLKRRGWPIALGGTSNHFDRQILMKVGGWDPHNVTEDADLGFRLAANGYHCALVDLPTLEEAPVHFRQWLPQRTRWIKGHMQSWLVVMRDPVGKMRDMGIAGFFGLQASFATALFSTFLHGPLLLLTLYHSTLPNGLASLVHIGFLSLGYFASLMGTIALSGTKGRILTLLTLPYYWPLMTLAAWRAIWELRTQPHSWSKTEHGLAPILN